MFPTPCTALRLAALTAAALALPVASAHAVGVETTITGGPAADTKTADSTPTFTFTSNVGDATFECSVNGSSYSACSSPKTLAAQTDGHGKTFSVRAVDGTTKDATPETRTFGVDTQAPVVTFVNTLSEGARTKDSTPTLKWSVEDLNSTAKQCSLDGAPFGSCTMPYTLPQLADGPHALTVRATDILDHVGSATRNFVVDTTAPVAKVTGIEAPIDAVRTFTFGAPADGGPGYAYFCRLDGGAEKPCASGFFATGPLAYGPHTFEVRAVDGIGNEQMGWTTHPFTVDPLAAPAPPTSPSTQQQPTAPTGPAAVAPGGAASSSSPATGAATTAAATAKPTVASKKKAACAKRKTAKKGKAKAKKAAATCAKKAKRKAAKRKGAAKRRG